MPPHFFPSRKRHICPRAPVWQHTVFFSPQTGRNVTGLLNWELCPLEALVPVMLRRYPASELPERGTSAEGGKRGGSGMNGSVFCSLLQTVRHTLSTAASHPSAVSAALLHCPHSVSPSVSVHCSPVERCGEQMEVQPPSLVTVVHTHSTPTAK